MKKWYNKLPKKKKFILHFVLIWLFFTLPSIFEEISFHLAVIWICIFILEILLIFFSLQTFVSNLIKRFKNINVCKKNSKGCDAQDDEIFSVITELNGDKAIIEKEENREILSKSELLIDDGFVLNNIYENEQTCTLKYPDNETFIFVDVETATFSNNTICSIGMIIVKNGKTYNFSSLINPKEKITNSQFHGITNEDVKTAPSLDCYWKNIEEYFKNNYIFIAHNSSFDINVLKKDLQRYNLSINPVKIIDTMWVAKDIYYNFNTKKGDLKLDTLCKLLKIELKHHNANSDITATKKLFELLLVKGNKNYKDFINNYYTKKKDEIENNINNVSYSEYWKDIENGKRPMYFTNWDKKTVDDIPFYDTVTIEDLIITSTIKTRAICDIERIYKQYKFIDNSITSIGGKILNKGSKSAKSYIEFYFMDYSEYKKLRFLGYKIFHANDVEDFFNERVDIINKFVSEKKQEQCEKELMEFEKERLKQENLLKKQKEIIEKEKQRQKKLQEKKLIIQLDDQGTIIKKYETLSAASIAVGVNPKSIRECCKGTQKHAGGYVWKYEKINVQDTMTQLKNAYDKEDVTNE